MRHYGKEAGADISATAFQREYAYFKSQAGGRTYMAEERPRLQIILAGLIFNRDPLPVA